MKIEFLCDEKQKEPKIAVIAAEKNGRTEELLCQLERMYGDTLHGYVKDCMELLRASDVIRIYSEDSRVLCRTHAGTYVLKERLWELEARLDPATFIRISKCEIVNKDRILRLDASLSGTIGVVLEGDEKTYTSRRYMQKIKAAFGL